MPLVNSYVQQKVQIKWDVSIHGRDLYLIKPTLGPSKKLRQLTRAVEVVITWLRICHTKATKSHILSRGPPIACQYRGQPIDHILLECAAWGVGLWGLGGGGGLWASKNPESMPMPAGVFDSVDSWSKAWTPEEATGSELLISETEPCRFYQCRCEHRVDGISPTHRCISQGLCSQPAKTHPDWTSPCENFPHWSLNSRNGVVEFGRAATGMSSEEVKDALNSASRNRDMNFVADTYRVTFKQNNEKGSTRTFFLTF